MLKWREMVPKGRKGNNAGMQTEWNLADHTWDGILHSTWLSGAGHLDVSLFPADDKS
jgi:hypothetical protein